jgi:transposase
LATSCRGTSWRVVRDGPSREPTSPTSSSIFGARGRCSAGYETGGRPRSVQLREILNGIFYITRGGCAWRMMPKDLPPWSTCYDSFRKWRNDGTWARIYDALRTQVRHYHQRHKSPSMGIIETSQAESFIRSTVSAS